MKKILVVLLLTIAGLTGFYVQPSQAAYSFGDYRSETLVTKAWGALAQNDIEGVLAYTNKCLELYADQAKKMQASLTDYPQGANEKIFSYWALNDVATALFIQGEAYRKANMMDEAMEVYGKIANYSFGQAWDPQGWFWKPAEAAKEKMTMVESGSSLDFGDYSSAFLTNQAWKALKEKDVKSVQVYVKKVLELYESKAKDMQSSLTEYPWESKDKIFSFWALNDVGTALYVEAEAYKNGGQVKEAKEVYKKLVENFSYAQCWDPQGWFWKPAEAAQQALDELENI